MSALVFTVPGTPSAWKRPADRARGASGRYDPNAAAKRVVAKYALAARAFARESIVRELPVGLRVVCAFATDDEARWGQPYTPKRRHDADNLVKLVLDALNGVLYTDDSQVAELEVAKVWAADASTTVELRILEVPRG